MHEGHRERMIERLMKGEESFEDHELLEILLFNAIPRKNTNEIAHNLLNSFQSLDGIFHADVKQLCLVKGVGASTAAYLRIIGLFYDRVKMEGAESVDVFSPKSFSEYLHTLYRGLTEEVCDIFCLDRERRISYVQRFSSDSRVSVTVQPEKITELLVVQKPYAIVIAHNHVTGSCNPSRQDDEFTSQVQLMCSINNVQLFDHFVVAENSSYSYYARGRLREIKEKFNVADIVKTFGSSLK